MEPEHIREERNKAFIEAYKELCSKYDRFLTVIDGKLSVCAPCTNCEVERNYAKSLTESAHKEAVFMFQDMVSEIESYINGYDEIPTEIMEIRNIIYKHLEGKA
jgi:hypothetical protein